MFDPRQSAAAAPARRQREVFLGALELTGAGARAAFLARACAGDVRLRRAVEGLLEEQSGIGSFLETPALGGLAASSGEEKRAGEEERAVSSVTEREGDRIGRYRLSEKIGEGGAGVVYLAEQEEPVRRRVALKVIKLGMDTHGVVARFEAERQALAMMDHPNIATVLDAGATAAGRPYFVMELVRGVKITEYCDRNHLPARERLALFIQVCHAVQHAHQKGIIHRDIKPSNILVTVQDGAPVPKVIDFGIAKATEQRLTEHTLLTAFTAFIGTPAYMSPEQAEMSPAGAGDIDTRSDVYSLGVLLYELLTGCTPFDPQSLLESGLDACRHTIREVEPARPSTRLQTLAASALTTTAQQRRVEPPQKMHLLRGDLDWVAMKCLEKDRRRRYQAASELAMDVQRYLANEPVLARPPSRLYRCQKFVRRHRGPLAAATGIVLALVAGTVVSAWQAIRATRAERDALAAKGQEERLRHVAEQERATARRNEYVADINLAQQAIVAGNLGRAMQLVDKHRPAPGEPDLRGFEWRYLWRLCQGDDHVSLPTQEASVQALALSPDTRLLAVGLRQSCTVWDLRTRTLVHRLAQGGASVTFSPDGLRLIAADRGAARVWNTSGWTEQRVLPGGTAPLALTRDGNVLATGSRQGVRIWTVSDGRERQWLSEASGPMAFSPDGRTLATNGRDGIRLWDWETGATRVVLADSANLFWLGGWWFGGGELMAFSADGRFLAAPRNQVSRRGAFVISVWDTASGAEVATLPNDPERTEHTGTITGLTFLSEARRFATASMDHSIRLWDFDARRQEATLHGHLNEVWALACSADGATLVSGAKDGGVKLWATRRPSARDVLPGAVRTLGFSPDGGTLAVITRSNTVAFLDWVAGEKLREFALEGGPPFFRPVVSVSRDLATLVQGLTEGRVRVADLTAGATRTLRVGHLPVELAVLSPDARSLVIGGRRQPARWWELDSGLSVPLEVEATQALFSADGSTLALIEPGSGIQLRDVATRALRVRLETDTEFTLVAALSPDGAQLATSGPAGADHMLELWDTATGRRLGECRGHKQGIHAVAFASDGRTLASAGADSTLKLWHVATRQELLSIQRLGARPTELLFSPDGQVLVGTTSPAVDAPGLLLYRAPRFEAIAAVERE